MSTKTNYEKIEHKCVIANCHNVVGWHTICAEHSPKLYEKPPEIPKEVTLNEQRS